MPKLTFSTHHKKKINNRKMDKGQGKFREEIMFNKHVKIIKFTSNHRNSNQMGPLLFTHDQISKKWRRALVAGMGNECCHGRLTWVWVGTTSSRAIKSLCLYSLHPNDSICKYLFYRDPAHVHKDACTRMFAATIHVARKRDIIWTSSVGELSNCDTSILWNIMQEFKWMG